MKKKIADLENWMKETKGKEAKDREEQVHAELLAKETSKASENSTNLASKLSKLDSMYGTQDNLNKPSVSVTKSSLKGASPAKKSRFEETRPALAESPHIKPGHRHMKLPEMPPQQGSQQIKIPPKKPQRQGSCSTERFPKKSLEQGPQSTERSRKPKTRNRQ